MLHYRPICFYFMSLIVFFLTQRYNKINLVDAGKI